ncbi:hypothetical protein [Thalassotalea sp. SU-HH00458]|uniref:hypothetical protein n=1 Tax=Thalassotalea sp. SU-HH00458 TaxID=3127657 RepID=UPI003365A8D7
MNNILLNRGHRYSFLLCGLLSVLLSINVKASNEVTVFSYPYVANNQGIYKSYNHQLLLLALEKTVKTHGPFSMNYIQYQMNEKRRRIEALKNTHPNFIISIVGDKNTFSQFAYSPFPNDLGLLGFRFLLHHKDNSGHFSHETTLEQLQPLDVVQGEGWFDSDVLRMNGFHSVMEVPSRSIGQMISFKRADLYFSSLVDVDKSRGGEVIVNPNVMLFYLSPRFFVSAKKNSAAIERIYTGLTLAYQDGSLEQLMDNTFLEKLKKFKILNRKVLELENKNLEGLDQRYFLWRGASKSYIDTRTN